MTAPRYQVGQAAELLGVSADTVRRWIDGGRLKASRSAGGPRTIAGTDLARFAVELAEQAADDPELRGRSARNRFEGIVTKVVKDTVMAQVEIQAGPHRVVALISREAADELGLAPGVLAAGSVKSTSVVVELPPP
ncbi:MAG: hypothetical protein QOJ67_473 [Acidimicrobiaceae bacterium]|jgi:molybdopterin-binding protein